MATSALHVALAANLTGILIGAVGVVVVSVVGFFAWIAVDDARSSRRIARLEELEARPVTRGVLICDWVDETVLATVAKQKEIEPEPVRQERGQGMNTSVGAERHGKRWLARAGRERRSDQRDYYEVPQDPNALLVKVLGRLSGSLVDTLDVVYGSDWSADTIDDIIRAAKKTPELEAARKAIMELQANAVQDAMIEQWQHAAQEARFELVGSSWKVLELEDPRTNDLFLSLQRLRRRGYAPGPVHGNPPDTGDVVDMPSELRLVVGLSRSRLTEQGKARLIRDAIIKAGVFGTTTHIDFKKGTMFLTPIAVFARVEDYD